MASPEGIAAGCHADLAEVYEAIADELPPPLISRRRHPDDGPMMLPFGTLDADALPLAGAEAVNLAKSRKRLVSGQEEEKYVTPVNL